MGRDRAAYMREWYQRNPEKRRANELQKQGRAPEQHRARTRVLNAIKRGDLARPELCEDCGRKPAPRINGTPGVHAHHEDYNRPLDVDWLCQSCHERRHHST